MVKKYRHSEFMWQKLAKIHFDGFIYHHETELLHYDKNYISGIRLVGLISFNNYCRANIINGFVL